jgi:hypothetical protein
MVNGAVFSFLEACLSPVLLLSFLVSIQMILELTKARIPVGRLAEARRPSCIVSRGLLGQGRRH